MQRRSQSPIASRLRASIAIFAVLMSFALIRICVGHASGAILSLMLGGTSAEWRFAIPLAWAGAAALLCFGVAPTTRIRRAAGILGCAALATAWLLFVRTSDEVPLTLVWSIPFVAAVVVNISRLLLSRPELRAEWRWQFTIIDALLALACIAAFFATYRFQQQSYEPVVDIVSQVDRVLPSGRTLNFKCVSFEHRNVEYNALLAEVLGIQEWDDVSGLDLHGMKIHGQIVSAAMLAPQRVELNLSASDVDDRDLASVGALTKLAILRLDHTAVNDRSAAVLSEHSRLECLDLSFTQISDAGLSQLAQSRTIGSLAVAGTPVTDNGVSALVGLAQLVSLDLRDTKVTKAGISKLKRLPRLRRVQTSFGEFKRESQDALCELSRATEG